MKSHGEAYCLTTQLKKIKWIESGTHMQRKKRETLRVKALNGDGGGGEKEEGEEVG